MVGLFVRWSFFLLKLPFAEIHFIVHRELVAQPEDDGLASSVSAPFELAEVLWSHPRLFILRNVKLANGFGFPRPVTENDLVVVVGEALDQAARGPMFLFDLPDFLGGPTICIVVPVRMKDMGVHRGEHRLYRIAAMSKVEKIVEILGHDDVAGPAIPRRGLETDVMLREKLVAFVLP